MHLVLAIVYKFSLSQVDLAPLAALFRLTVLDASDNVINSLRGVVHIVKDLKKLQTLLLCVSWS